MLLQIIRQKGEICGYEIDKIVKIREYREWANIGRTSIYKGLEKLAKKHLVTTFIDTDKQGKGPLPKKFKLTETGQITLKNEIFNALSSSRERDKKFDLAFAAIDILTPKEVISALSKRKDFLLEAAKKVEKKFESLGGDKLPVNIKALFKHSLYLIKNERKFLDTLMVELKAEKGRKRARSEG
ncbi:MAG: helix-turn-helix transcriptional regulator [Planctomycetota bacterium]|jgi:DNA-binding PadR family transcriptional regulator